MTRPDLAWLEDIREACAHVRDFVEGMTYDEFVGDVKTRSAVLHQLTVIGEAATQLSQDLRQRHPDVDWKSIIGFRIVAVHKYFGLNWSMIWETATLNCPQVAMRVETIIDEMRRSSPDT